MRILCVFGQHQYGDPARGLGTEFAAFIPALRDLGHEVHHFDSWNRGLYRDLADLNLRLVKTVEDLRPELMLTVHMEYELWLETLDLIRTKWSVATVSWAADDSWKYREVSRFVGPHYDAMTTTYDYRLADYRADGIDQVLLTQWAADSRWLGEPRAAADCRYAVSFVGAAHGDRRQQIEALAGHGIEVVCFGHGWPEGPVESEDVPRIVRDSVISLNFANSRGENQIKARTFEVPGAGGFLLTGKVRGLDRYYRPGQEVAVYDGVDDLVEQIRYFLSHPEQRDRIARAGFERTRAEHTYEQRLSEVLDFTLSAKRPATVSATEHDFAVAAARHRPTALLKLTRSILLAITRVLFGAERGRRAARRLVFELSWRLAGRRTFTAAGLPGRLFPHD